MYESAKSSLYRQSHVYNAGCLTGRVCRPASVVDQPEDGVARRAKQSIQRGTVIDAIEEMDKTGYF